MPHPRFDAFRKRIAENFPKHFWSYVKQGDEDECWPWTGYTSNKYGSICRLSKMVRSHRVAYELAKGPIPEGIKVLHTCDNPPCCNPNHLFLGTQKDNTLDCIAKNRFVVMHGSKNGNSKLKEKDVLQIRARFKKGQSCASIAKSFRVSASTIELIRNGRLWKRIQLPL